MKRAGRHRTAALVCLLWVICAAGGACAADWGDYDKTHFSSGTGGTESRVNEPLIPYEIEYPSDVNEPMTVHIEDNVPLQRAVTRWLNEKRASHDPRDDSWWDEGVHCVGNVLSIVHEDDSAMFDLVSGRQLALSDLFYDEFNYIEFINLYVAAQVLADGEALLDEDWAGYSSFDEVYLPPFTVCKKPDC